MTPQDALAKALDSLDMTDCLDASSILAALAADGWTVARTQDARDGEALARLRDALPEGFGEVRSLWDDEDGWAVWTLHEDTDPDNPDAFGRGDTLDAAADACREAIEATR